MFYYSNSGCVFGESEGSCSTWPKKTEKSSPKDFLFLFFESKLNAILILSLIGIRMHFYKYDFI